jgi:hypothetical protein
MAFRRFSSNSGLGDNSNPGKGSDNNTAGDSAGGQGEDNPNEKN